MSRSKNRIREKKFSNFTFYAYFYKGNFKALPERLFSAEMTKFFRRILKIFLISKTISTWVLEVFLDVSEQVFILVYDVWMRFRENRQKIQSVAILVRAFLYKFNEALRKGGNEDPLCLETLSEFRFPGLQSFRN